MGRLWFYLTAIKHNNACTIYVFIGYTVRVLPLEQKLGRLSVALIHSDLSPFLNISIQHMGRCSGAVRHFGHNTKMCLIIGMDVIPCKEANLGGAMGAFIIWPPTAQSTRIAHAPILCSGSWMQSMSILKFHTEVEAKWPSFCRWHFQRHVLLRNFWIPIPILLIFVPMV